jgi:hypothetical protein
VCLPNATQPQLWLSMVHPASYSIYLERMSSDMAYLKVPRGIDDALKALRKQSGRTDPPVRWGMVNGGGRGMLRMFLISRLRVQAAVY